MEKIILASASPRRAELLSAIGADFEVHITDADERVPASLSPSEQVSMIAKRKCAAVAPLYPENAVLAADTLVSLDGIVLGKPHDEREAMDMLRTLSGRWHKVFTGVCVMRGGFEACEFCETSVLFRELTDEKISRYVASGEPMDKAGAYGIQRLGALLVEKIDGDYFNVVGLPLVLTAKLLKGAGITLL